MNNTLRGADIALSYLNWRSSHNMVAENYTVNVEAQVRVMSGDTWGDWVTAWEPEPGSDIRAAQFRYRFNSGDWIERDIDLHGNAT